MIDLIVVALLQAVAGAPEAVGPAAPTETQSEVTAPSAPAATETPAVRPQDRMRCRRETIVGSRLARRVCLTAGQEQEIDDESRDQLRRMVGSIPLQGN